ncbi:unnamed protein product [Mytilus coruscus]|uniref:Uncharacterized protein n=1 Tax=Mytilus coruscus TaxID=42192 RepID=A0A6J8B8Q8_MYTCO|nr:unnamed protein product [Mytilus coruscus]
MEFLDLSAESLRLSMVMNACGISLPLINLHRKETMYSYNVGNIINNREKEPKVIIAGSAAEGLGMTYNQKFKHLSSSDTDIIIMGYKFKIYEDINEKGYVEALYLKLNHVLRVPDNTHSGYSKLAVSQISQDLRKYCDFQDKKVFLKNTMKEKIFEIEEHLQTNLSIHGPAVSADLHPRNLASYFEQEGGRTPVNITNFEKDCCYGIEDTDFVFCLQKMAQ